MDIGTLSPSEITRLRAADLTYREVGHAGVGPVPGYGWLERRAVLRRTDFGGAAHDLMRWQIQRRAGLRVRASHSPLTLGSVVVMRLGPGPVALSIPCRVVEVIDEPDRCGFAYGTLPGHPETGEERFELRRLPTGGLELTIQAFSRPSSLLARAGGPVTTWAQAVMTGRYLRALDAI